LMSGEPCSNTTVFLDDGLPTVIKTLYMLRENI